MPSSVSATAYAGEGHVGAVAGAALLDPSRPAEAVRADLARAASRLPPGAVDPDEIMREVAAGRAQVHPLPGGSIVAYLDTFGGVHVLAAAGSISEILAYEPAMCAWYKARGAVRATLCGRRGWGRVMRPLGWRPVPGCSRGDMVKEL